MLWNEWLGNQAHKIVHGISKDMQDNTLTFAATTAFGAGAGARGAAMAAKSGLTFLPRNVAGKTIVGGANGALKYGAGHAIGIAGTPAGKAVKMLNKVGDIEKAFDQTKVGKAIDNEIAYGEQLAHQGINKIFGM